MAIETITVPDIGGAENVDVIEVSVVPGDVVAVEDSLIVLESDKASMEVPSPKAGKVVSLKVKQGDTVSKGDSILELEVEVEEVREPETIEAPTAEPPEPSNIAPAAVESSEMSVTVPDIGGAENVDVIELCVAVGDEVSEGDSLIVLESDKASMEVPSPASGKVLSLSIKEGDKVSQGSDILVLATASVSSSSHSKPIEPSAHAASVPVEKSAIDVPVPDIGGAESVDVIEICVSEGDDVAEGDSLIVLESDKASMEVPSPEAGKVIKLLLKEGDKVSQGSVILQLETAISEPQPQTESEEPPQLAPVASQPSPKVSSEPELSAKSSASDVYAGPAVRKLARQLGVDLSKVSSSGPRNRYTKDDVRNYVKNILQGKTPSFDSANMSGIPPIPEVDFSQFGEVELVKMSKIKKLTALNMSRNWLNVPHVTQFDEADITELETFRKGMKAEAEQAGVKLTPLPFLLKACAASLKAEPSFNVSMHADGEHIVHKHYVHIGMAVDTPKGLMVPVIRDVDKKGLLELAEECITLAKKARDGKLMPKDMQGACFTISSLGAIGGTGFTPIINAPEVAILGVSKASIKPVWDGNEFVPRQLLPLSLSYDHRAINGGDAGRFFTYLSSVLKDVRRLLL